MIYSMSPVLIVVQESALHQGQFHYCVTRGGKEKGRQIITTSMYARLQKASENASSERFVLRTVICAQFM